MSGLRRTAGTRGTLAVLGFLSIGLPILARGSDPLRAAEPGLTAQAAPVVANDEFATLEAPSGRVTVIRLGQVQPLAPSMPLRLNDIVVTKEGRATVRFRSDGAVVRIGPDSRVQIDENAKERDITLFFGRLWAHVVRFKERPTRFKTSSTIAAIRGTEISMAVATDGDETQVSVLEGSVVAGTDIGDIPLKGGQTALGRKGKAPTLAVKLRPQDAVQWALYYLPVISFKPSEVPAGPAQARVGQSIEAFAAGDLARAQDSLDNVNATEIRDARFFTYRASVALATGNVQSAGNDLEQALKLSPGDGDALALRTIMEVVGNQADKAMETARLAVAGGPKSASAQIAQSYARQAKFDLAGARENLETAVTLKPDDALAWARLAEIRSSLGSRSGALEAAEKAVALQPNLSRTQTILGYSYLTQVKTAEARAAFAKAADLDKSDPLPRLGMGLAQIRDGKLAEGTKEIEIAASLDPGQALVRSYLGKAYFEGKRAPLDDREYGVAKELDPKDPTPRLYDAIAKQTTNRPVEALENVQKAIELNDNRGVYRSRLLLDQDLAARSASLGRIYSDLGFQNLALVEGWNSVGTDPANYSAHRLLADSYAALPRHEIARVSELFQSQMLQPLNTTPIQPRLGESSSLLIGSQGPGSLAFNEFNPLFNRDQVNLQGSFLVGQDDSLMGEGIVSGIHKKFSFSAGYSGFKTDGFRENNSQEDQLGSAFAQLELSPSTSVQAEVRHRRVDSGDLGLRFFENDFKTLQAEKTDSTSVRVGLRQDFGPAMTVLASYMHSDKSLDFGLPDPALAQTFSNVRDEKADSLEGQFLFRSPSVKVVAGGGYFDIDAADTTVFDIVDPVFGLTDTTTGDPKIKHTNVYGYSYFTLPRGLNVTLGLSGDLFEETGQFFQDVRIPDVPSEGPVPVVPAPVLGEKNKANPKLGATWSLKSGTTLRAAWFKTLKRTLITDQTLEPTQVAGFNQFFDDLSATESRVYGVAVDQKFGKKLFGGVEYSRRELTIPQNLLQDGTTWILAERSGDERQARAYLFAAPHPWLTLGAEYQRENFELDRALFLSFDKVKTHRLPLSARFFHPSGWSGFVGVTYLKQDGDFLIVNEVGESDYIAGSKSFSVVDAAVRFRLPKRYGFVVAGVNNLTDNHSTYEATDSRNLSIRPGRVVYARLVLALP